jgi:riboflavin kinase
MQMKSLPSWGNLSITRKENSLAKSEHLNLPDLQFFNGCHVQYGLNKGVYNTIDNWFYEYGIVHILSRRIYLLAFLEFAKEKEPEQNEHKVIRFGNGGLVKKLYEFLDVYKEESMGAL